MRKILLDIFTIIAKKLPLWKQARSVVVHPPMLSLPVQLPLNYNTLPANFAEKFVRTKSIPGRRIFILSKVYVSGQAVVFKNLRVFIPSLTWLRDLDLFRKGNLLIKQWGSKVKTVPGSTVVALVYDDWSANNYYHWMIESLPRLLMVKQKFPAAILLIPDPAPEYITASIKLMDFTNVYPLNRHPLHIVKLFKLVVPELVYYEEKESDVIDVERDKNKLDDLLKPLSGEFALALDEEELIVPVRRLLLQKIIACETPPSRKIFISRSKQKTRRLLNETDLLTVLKKYHFEILFFEGMTLIEQVSLMNDTAIFVSVHGSNMVNILFMQQGSKVIELMNKEYLNDAYYLLSSSIDLPYYSMPCAIADESINLADDSVAMNDADLVVGIPELEKLIQLAIQ